MKKITLDAYEVNIGSRLYCLIYGWGKVTNINDNNITAYPISIEIEGKPGFIATYTESGRNSLVANRTLFWDKIEITPPGKPKIKVKKWKWVAKNSKDELKITCSHYKDQEDYDDKNSFVKLTLVQKIDSTEKIDYE